MSESSTCSFAECDKPPGDTLCPGHRRQQRAGQELRPLQAYGYLRRECEGRPGPQSTDTYAGWRAKEFRHRLRTIKVERGCVDCGYDVHPDALDFDHLPGQVKLFKLGGYVGSSWDTIVAEIAKCEVVCANCHRIRTRKRAGWDDYVPQAPPGIARNRPWAAQPRS